MAFLLTVNVDDGNAPAKVAAIGAALGKTTESADKARDAMGRFVGNATGLASLAAACEKAATSTKHLADEATVGTGTSDKLKAAYEAMLGTLAREADIIERVRGPMREYRADMDALESLYKRNKLSAAEYDDELQRLIKTQGTMHGPTQEQQKAGGPSVAGVAGGFASGGIQGALTALPGIGMLMGAVGQIREMVQAYKELQDEYTTLTNNAMKFVDAGHSVNVVIDEQVAMSAKLHAKLATTIGLYDSVRDGTDSLNVSHAEQNRLLQSMGEAFILAGKGVENAGGLMEKFSYALSSGKMETRELKGIMREVPEIADIWTEHFGMTRVELTKALASGKIGTEDLMQAILAETSALDANYAKRKATNAELEEEFRQKERIITQRQGIMPGSSGGAEGNEGEIYSRAQDEAIEREKERVVALKAKRDEMTKMVGTALEQNAALAATAAAAERAGISIGEYDQGAADATSRTKIFLESVGVAMPNAFSEARNRAAQLNIEVGKVAESKVAEKLAEDVHKLWRELNNVNDVLVAQKKHWDDISDHAGQLKQAVANSPGAQLLARGLPSGMMGITITRDDAENVRALRAQTLELDTANSQFGKTINEAKTRTNEHRDAVNDLKGAYAAHGITFKEYTDGLKAAGVEESAAAKLLHDLNEPAKQWGITLGALGVLLQGRTIDAAKYNDELLKLIKSQAAVSEAANLHGMAVGPRKIGGMEVSVAYEPPDLKQIKEVARSFAEMGIEERQATASENEFTWAFDKGIATQLKAVDAQAQVKKQMLETIGGPQKQYMAQLQALDDLLREQTIGTDDYARTLAVLREKLLEAKKAAHELTGNEEFRLALRDWAKAAEDLGSAIGAQLTGDLEKFNAAIVTVANGGKVAWGEMVISMIEDIEKLMLKWLEAKVVMGIIDAVGTGAAASASNTAGTDFAAGAVSGASAGVSRVASVGAYPYSSATGGVSQTAAARQAPVVVQIHNHYDESVVHAAMNSPKGALIIANQQRANAGSFRR